MKYILTLIIALSLVSCSKEPTLPHVVTIRGYDRGIEVIRGMGVCIGSTQVLTSAHVVGDDRLSYMADGMRISVISRDIQTDRAILSISEKSSSCRAHRAYIGVTSATLGQDITIPVSRSGAILTLTGRIISLTGQVLAYDATGRSRMMTGLLLTDISLLPGDSGAPILDRDERVIDVVHVAGK